jgi:uncharacterized protein YecE (DUF72 family)
MGAWTRDALAISLASLAQQGIFIGTSSWKYSGWRGQIYTDDRYVFRGNFSEARFDRLCLAEYAEVFKTVCVDAAYYKFPDAGQLSKLMSLVPPDFQFSFKVTDQITIKKFPALPRFGPRAGTPNPEFLNSDLFAEAFLSPCAPFRSQIGLLIFEFSHFAPQDFARGRDFAAALDAFLSRLPAGWRYGVETRNRTFLHPDYFATLARHGVCHIFNSWQDMPAIEEQCAIPGAHPASDFFGARFLLRPGRKYEAAVKAFAPYDQIRDEYPEGRSAGAQLVRRAQATGARAFIYVNNRFEGNAPATIAAMLEQAHVARF